MNEKHRSTYYRAPNALFVQYLNTLHNLNADNPSAYTELSISSPYFRKTMVEREVGDYIQKQLKNEKPHVFILTGHAGDGKTALLYQTLKAWGCIADGEKLEELKEYKMPNGRGCRCIKDFSELEADKRKIIMRDILECPSKNLCAFLVANTGPLISTFSELMDQDYVNKLVGAIDDNSGAIIDYDGIPISAINVATIDNSSFVAPYLHKVLDVENWAGCKQCEKSSYCPIYTNYQLLSGNIDNICSFVSKHYIWQQEHGNKLTIRQIVAHMAYTITGGLECSRVRNASGIRFSYLCSNLFFGYKGVRPDMKAASVKAIADIVNAAYDQKRLRADEQLFIKDDYSALPTDLLEVIESDGRQYKMHDGWRFAIRRAYILLNQEHDYDKRDNILKDVFSEWYPRYLAIRDGSNPGPKDKELIIDALKMLFLGSLTDESEVPVTMRRDENKSQCVQLVYDTIKKGNIKLNLSQIYDFSKKPRYRMFMSIKSDRITTPISLPIMNHFEEMKRGAIQTNVDPQLSQGIDSIRAQLIALVESSDTDLELRMVSANGWRTIRADFDDGTWSLS